MACSRQSPVFSQTANCILQTAYFFMTFSFLLFSFLTLSRSCGGFLGAFSSFSSGWPAFLPHPLRRSLKISLSGFLFRLVTLMRNKMALIYKLDPSFQRYPIRLALECFYRVTFGHDPIFKIQANCPGLFVKHR